MKFLRIISELLRFDRTNWTALALCLFAAAIFWIFNALNENYSTNLSFPLHLEYDETKYATADRIPPKLTVNVSGIGWELLRKSLGHKVPVISIPLERPSEVHRIAGASLAPQVMSQIGNMQLNYVVLDTLRLSIEPKASRTLNLYADISQVAFRNGMGRVSPVVVLPDSIQLDGPASFLKELPDSIIIRIPSRVISASYRENLEVLLENAEFINRNPPVVEVMFEVAPVVEVSRHLAVPAAKSSGIHASTDSLRILVQVPGRDQERFNQDFRDVVAILPEVELNRGDTVQVLPRLLGLPPYASLIHVDSVQLRRHP